MMELFLYPDCGDDYRSLYICYKALFQDKEPSRWREIKEGNALKDWDSSYESNDPFSSRAS